jgi:hypothetical protein
MPIAEHPLHGSGRAVVDHPLTWFSLGARPGVTFVQLNGLIIGRAASKRLR